MAEEKKKPEAAPAAPPAEGAAAKSEEGKEGKAPEAAAKPSSAASPWLPVLVVIIVLPILSFVMTESIMLPRIKKALGDIAAVQAASAQPSEGGPLAAPHTSEKKSEKKGEKKKEAGKEGEKGKEGAAASKDTTFENIVANLSGSMKSRFVKVSFVIEGDDEEFGETIKESRTKIIDSALGILGALTVAELEEPGMKNIVRNDLIDSFNQTLQRPLVKRLYFSEFIIQ